MPRAMSIHIGVNQPQKRSPGLPLQCSESTAWGMAAVAERAGYDSLRVLRGEEATRQAVNDALADAAGKLGDGDSLFVSFSGHGTQVKDVPDRLTAQPEPGEGGFDEVWCLHDDHLKDDQLAAYWPLFEAGVRILVVSESCFGGGMTRVGKCPSPYESEAGGAQPARAVVYRSAANAGGGARPPIEPPKATQSIQASLLLIAACGKDQHAYDGVFTRQLFAVWNNGAFRGTYSDLYQQVHDRVVAQGLPQQPRMQLLGADQGFLQLPAFHLDREKQRSRAGYR